jgi:hypothetical protein
VEAIAVFGVDDCRAAVHGVWLDEWARDHGRTDLEWALRDDLVERFAGLHRAAQRPRAWSEAKRRVFDERWMAGYVAHIKRIVASPKMPLVGDPWGRGWPIMPEAVSVVDGVKIPRFDDYRLDAMAGNLAAAVAVQKMISGEGEHESKFCAMRVQDCVRDFNSAMAETARRTAT